MTDIVATPLHLDHADAPTTVASSNEPLLKRDLGLLGHVNVPLQVSLGSAELSIDRLFGLRAGDTVALGTGLDEPVALRLDGKIVARGHLVAVGDHFGLRISEILG
jgi:flagellar motor switch protein FliN/FliY